jgi:hypothetical protein
MENALTHASQFVVGAFKDSADDSVHTQHVSQELVDKVKYGLIAEEGGQLLSELFIVKCLVYHQLNVERAIETSAGFLRFRHGVSWPLSIPENDVAKALRTGIHWLIPRRPKSDRPQDYIWQGNRTSADAGPAACIVLNMAQLDTTICGIEEYQKVSCFLMERMTDDVEVQQRGIALIMDFKDVQLSRLKSLLSNNDIRRGIMLWKGAFPCRLRRVWFLDAPLALRCLIWGTLRLLRPYVRERVRVAQRSSGLDNIAQDLSELFELPESLGGAGEFDWESTLRSCLDAVEPARQSPRHFGTQRCILQL